MKREKSCKIDSKCICYYYVAKIYRIHQPKGILINFPLELGHFCRGNNDRTDSDVSDRQKANIRRNLTHLRNETDESDPSLSYFGQIQKCLKSMVGIGKKDCNPFGIAILILVIVIGLQILFLKRIEDLIANHFFGDCG